MAEDWLIYLMLINSYWLLFKWKRTFSANKLLIQWKDVQVWFFYIYNEFTKLDALLGMLVAAAVVIFLKVCFVEPPVVRCRSGHSMRCLYDGGGVRDCDHDDCPYSTTIDKWNTRWFCAFCDCDYHLSCGYSRESDRQREEDKSKWLRKTEIERPSTG